MKIETENAQRTGERRRGGLRKLVGLLLAAIGFCWLAKEVGWIPVEHGHLAIFWPVALFTAGMLTFFGSRCRHTA